MSLYAVRGVDGPDHANNAIPITFLRAVAVIIAIRMTVQILFLYENALEKYTAEEVCHE